MQRTKVFHGEFLLQGSDCVAKKRGIGGRHDNVINIGQQINNLIASVVDEQRSVRLGFNKSERQEVGGKPTVPSARSLLQTIPRIVEAANMVRKCSVSKSSGLAAINSLGKGPMEESIDHCCERAKESTVRTVAGFTIGLKVSS